LTAPSDNKTAARPGFSRRAALFFLFLSACAAAPARAADAPGTAPAAVSGSRAVRRVTDGDTLVLEDGEKVRLIGIDTPELHDPSRNAGSEARAGLSARLVDDYSVRAREFLTETLRGRRVRLEYDRERTDRFGRTLAYAYREPDGLFLNAEMVKQGYAFAYTRFPFGHSAEFRLYEREAKEARRGVWADR
jgi:micrococcal nuclease